MQWRVHSLDELPQVASAIIQELEKEKVISFKGQMGAGKTTLVAEICKQLKVQDSISSPTYSLVNEYNSPTVGTVFHFDFYRLNSEEEALDFGVEEYLYSPSICLLEWAEKIESLLPVHYLEVEIEQEKDIRVFKLKHV